MPESAAEPLAVFPPTPLVVKLPAPAPRNRLSVPKSLILAFTPVTLALKLSLTSAATAGEPDVTVFGTEIGPASNTPFNEANIDARHTFQVLFMICPFPFYIVIVGC